MSNFLSRLVDVECPSPHNGQYLTWDAATNLWKPKFGVQIASITSGDSSNSSNPAAWADVTGLASFSLIAGRVYVFNFYLVTSTSASTNWAQFGINSSGSCDIILVNVERCDNGLVGSFNGFTAAAFDTGADITASAGNTKIPVRVFGLVSTTAAGTFALRHKNHTAGAVTTVHVGSYGIVWEVGT